MYKRQDFSTDILAYIASDEEELRQLKENTTNVETSGLSDLIQRDNILEKRIIHYFDQLTTKDIGDIGENLVHGHECMRIKLGGREDLSLIHISPAHGLTMMGIEYGE